MQKKVICLPKSCWNALTSLILVSLLACGQDPSFVNLEQSSSSSRSDESESTAHQDSQDLEQATDGEPVWVDINGNGEIDEGEMIAPEQKNPSNNQEDDTQQITPPTGGTINGGINPDDVTFDNVDNPDDITALHRCLSKWNELPFASSQLHVRKIAASVTVGGFGNAVLDNEVTAEPQLTLITAAVNVGGAPVYQLLNPNGYYCIKVNVNVATNLTINLHCNARLADSTVNVNVGSVMNDNTSAIGVHVGSQVTVNTVRRSGDQCIR